jgi:uncharacterized repeat protein (TIGR03803 family)
MNTGKKVSQKLRLVLLTSMAVTLLLASSSRGGVVLTTLVSFDGTNGADPAALVQGADGNFYGTTGSGGIGFCDPGRWGGGKVYRMTPGGALTNLVWFDGTNGNNGANLIQGTDGNFYGTTLGGTSTSYGTVFKMTSEGALTSFDFFTSFELGINPVGLAQDTNGDLYGTTQFGGESDYGCGTIFRIRPDGTFATVTLFDGTNGLGPIALVRGADGNFYGVTQKGGPGFDASPDSYDEAYGTMFKVTHEGALTSLFSFDGTNGSEPQWLLQSTAGPFYGVTLWGGDGFGTVFKISPNGALCWSIRFNGTNGALPFFLMQGADGNLYGTTSRGGTGFDGPGWSGYGTVFKVTPDGTFTNLLLFDGTNGAEPSFLAQGADGNLYGTTWAGGPSIDQDLYGRGYGTVFRLSVPMAPVFRTIARSNDTLSLAWSTVAGQSYQLQCKSGLFSTNWNDLGGAVVATNGTMSASDSIGSIPQRYYRVVLLP